MQARDFRLLSGGGRMRRFIGLFSLLSLSGCVMPTTVQRLGVDYNDALAGMTDELVLKNILRGKADDPLHYTALSRATGAVTVKATTGFNAALKARGFSDGTSSATTAQNTTNVGGTGPASSAVGTLMNGASSMIASGGNVLTPSVGGEIDTGPSFDVSILNDPKFENGITTELSYPIIDNLIAQGFDEELVLRLTINTITFRMAEDNPQFTRRKKDDIIMTIGNPAYGDDAYVIASTAACFDLIRDKKPDPQVIGTLDRFTHDSSGKVKALELKDLSLLDGKQFDLKGQIGLPANDKAVLIQRPGQGIVPTLKAKPSPFSEFGPRPKATPPSPRAASANECYLPLTIHDKENPDPKVGFQLLAADPGVLPSSPPAAPVFTAGGTIYVPNDTDGRPIAVKANIEITFRPTESVFRFVGQYVQASRDHKDQTYLVRDHPLFVIVDGSSPNSLVSTTYRNQRYSIPDNEDGRRDMQIIAILEQLMNLQKSADAPPQTVPVRVIPGG
jgi:hypothetical protein